MDRKHSVKSRIILFIVLKLKHWAETWELKYDKEWNYIVNKKDNTPSPPLLRNRY